MASRFDPRAPASLLLRLAEGTIYGDGRRVSRTRIMPFSVHELLGSYDAHAQSTWEKGDTFERFVKAFLLTDPKWSDLFSDVWLWMEWPDRAGKPDTGIDLVAQERATGDYWAIQAKFYHPEHILDKSDIDSFFTASGKKPFNRRMIISTTDRWGKNAQDALDGQHIPVTRLGLKDLDQSGVDWTKFVPERPDHIELRPKKQIRKHQREALDNVIKGFQESDRGKLIMACGTGKTFVALKLAEELVPRGGTILFLVPSISLISQSLSEWAYEGERAMHFLAVCSDPKVGKKSDSEDIAPTDLAYPAHTNPKELARQYLALRRLSDTNATAIFSTYQSIEVIAQAQQNGLPAFDLIISDEAHRTTGVERDGETSPFIRVHDPKFLAGKKRLYMTATPRIYDDSSKSKAKEADVEIYSMDDETKFGPEFHRLDFSEAVRRDLLSDYKVMVLAVDEKHVGKAFQRQLADKDLEMKLDDAVKIVGCWNGLSKRITASEGETATGGDPSPMRRAVAFSRSIKDSKHFTGLFSEIIDKYLTAAHTNPDLEGENGFLRCEVDHVDGTMNALTRSNKLYWLKQDTASNGTVCRILSNARCLSEGVDVPALDAVMFLNPRNSVVDVVQAVGRVMRKAPGKEFGYIILPIGIPADIAPEDALANNERYRIVWQVLQALRAHDDRFNAVINKLELNKQRPDNIQVIGVGGGDEEREDRSQDLPLVTQLHFSFPELDNWKDAIYAKIVVKCGTRKYWETWAKDIAVIAQTHISRIKALIEGSDSQYRERFDEFLEGLKSILNPSISHDDAVEMLAQHLVTKPVFDALFEGYNFTEKNPVSITMQSMLDLLEEQNIGEEAKTLKKFYESVRERASGIDNAEGKQKIIIELYDKFFKNAFPRMADRLGIVYTPVEVVDFILRSADHALRQEFGVGLTDKGVDILDPFTGTGTFIVRLIQSGLIEPKDLSRKYAEELHANEIILLAYYIAAVNIEAAYHTAANTEYAPFEGIVLTDTFQMMETKGTLNETMFPENNKRAARQSKRDIRVIVANPPYMAKQENVNDANQNLTYPRLDERIRNTYAANTSATNKTALYDSYIRAIRWASDRIGDTGIVCYVTNGTFIDGNSMDGLRACLANEFTSIYCFNLRGNQRTQGDESRREGGKVFGSGSRAPIAITLLVKNPKRKTGGKVHYHDIGDYLTREQKLKMIAEFGSVAGVEWNAIAPNRNHDWINQRDPAFGGFVPIGDKATKGASSAQSIFVQYSGGVKTSRDIWAGNYSKRKLNRQMSEMIAFFNQQVEFVDGLRKKGDARVSDIDVVIDNDPTRISWSRGAKDDVRKGRKGAFDLNCIRVVHYRPFSKQYLYFSRQFNDMVYRIHQFYPTAESKNPALYVSGPGGHGLSSIMTDHTPDLNLQHSGGQCFPLRVFEGGEDDVGKLDFSKGDESGWRLNISDYAHKEFQKTYGDKTIGKEDIFYYVYGVLHSPEYRQRFAADLKKMLPRIPYAEDFWAFSKAGRKLADLHLNYEKVDPYPVQQHCDVLALDPAALYRVEKMYFGKRDKKPDKTTIIYNSHITLSGIPLEAYEYVVNGKPAIEWIMERYQITKDKASGIVNDPNDWAIEHDDPEYILRLLKSIITVSIETMKIVNGLPPLNER